MQCGPVNAHCHRLVQCINIDTPTCDSVHLLDHRSYSIAKSSNLIIQPRPVPLWSSPSCWILIIRHNAKFDIRGVGPSFPIENQRRLGVVTNFVFCAVYIIYVCILQLLYSGHFFYFCILLHLYFLCFFSFCPLFFVIAKIWGLLEYMSRPQNSFWT